MPDKVIYTVEGTVQASGGIYISREADEELLRLCRAGEFCYVLAARQTGKSSLMVATKKRLAAEGIRSVEIDLTQMGSKLTELTAEQWYLGLIDFIVDQLDLDVDYVAWWDERVHLGLTQRLSQFLRQVVLEQVSKSVGIFIDEIDSTLNLDFTDDFFAAIRACYNARASDPAFKHLSFVLLGVATPTDLIKDPTRTPFNIGRRVDLTDFTEQQAIPLANGLGLPPVEAGQVLIWIIEWTGGHPYLTQRLCTAIAASPTKNWDAATVDKLVEETFLGEQGAQDHNLRFVRDMLTQRAPDKAAVLKTYGRIRAGKAVPDEERSLVKTHLKLSGIVKAKDGYLDIRNKIYRHVFDLAWVRENTPVNRTRIVASVAIVAIVVAVLAVGYILYDAWMGIHVGDVIGQFYRSDALEEKLALLAEVFASHGLFGSSDYDYEARELFYGLSREEQLDLFSVYNDVKDSDLMVVVRGLYTTLADTDGMDSTGPLLEALLNALNDLKDKSDAAEALKEEILFWLEGRGSVKDGEYTEARDEYDRAIALNGENPATRYERARVLIELSQQYPQASEERQAIYEQALSDLDQVMAIAGRAPAPTPTPSPSVGAITVTSTSTAAGTSTPEAVKTPIVRPSPSVAVSPTSSSVSTETPTPTTTPKLAPITSEFRTTGEMISAVRNMIDGNPDLARSLASSSSSEYPNLRKFGLVPTSLSPTVQGPNLLKNPGFEEGFSERGAGEVTVANGWEAWWIQGSEEQITQGYLMQPEYKPEDGSVFSMQRVHSGRFAQKYFTTYATHIGGIYQQVAVVEGNLATFSIWVQVWSSTEPDPDQCEGFGNYEVWAGIDPHGGVDGTSGNTVWSDSVMSCNEWVQLSVSTVAQADTVTVFTKGAPDFRVKFNDSYWDDAVLTSHITVEEFVPKLTLTPFVSPTSGPGNVRLVSELELVIADPPPRVGDGVKAIFTVRNYGGQTFTAAKFLVKGRGPDDSIQDFPPIDNFELEPGEDFTYIESRSFSMGGEHWFTPYYSPDGDNWFDVLFPNGQSSRVEITVDGLPVVEHISVEPSTIHQGEAFVISVTASDDFGLQSIRWWGENTGDDYLNKGREASCGEITRCSQRWPALKWTGKEGEFAIYAEARDTVGQVSSPVSATITIAARFSLLIGGGPFANESVQNALGFGINWGELEEEIGEVVLVDFASEETLPEMAYRSDSAKELLAEAGYAKGFDAVLMFDPDDKSAGRLADLLTSQLSSVGIRTEYLWVASDNARDKFDAITDIDGGGLLIERR